MSTGGTMARLLLPVALALGWIAALAAAVQCPVSMTRLGPTTKRGPVKKAAGSKVTITADVRTTQAVDNAVVSLFMPADFKLLKWSTTRAGVTAPIIDGQTVYWRNVTLTPGGKKPAQFKLITKIPNCYPTSTVQVLGATYQIDATDGLPACLQNAQPATISIRGHKRTKPYDGSTCSGAGAVSCYPGFYAVNASAPCEPCGINKVCGGGTQPAPELVDCPLGTGTITGEFSAYDPASCVVLPCNPCGSTTPDLYLTSKLSVYKQPAWAPGLPLDTDTAELQCTLDQTDTFICQVTSSCTLNDIAIDNQGNYILLGRRKDSGTGTGWVIKVDPKDIVPGEPCPYTVLLGELQQPWAGLGAAPKSNLFYGIGAGSVFTVQVTEDSAQIIGQVTDARFSGAADVTAAPNGEIYATVGTQGYTIGVNASYIPQPGGITAVASGSIGLGAPAAFCTSQQPYAISSSTYDAYEFPAVTDPLSGFNRIGGSGLDAGINGAAVAPVCGF